MPKNKVAPRVAYEYVTWEDVAKQVVVFNPEFAKIIDKIPQAKNYKLVKVRYPYGAKIIDQGTLCLPLTDGQVVPITHTCVPLDLISVLAYCSIPLTMVIHNKAEVFVESDDYVIPLNLFSPGEFFGTYETMDLLTNMPSGKPPWTVTAGVRSTFLLPKVSDTVSHNKLKRELGVTSDAPKSFFEQWSLFKQIVQHAQEKDAWYSEVLIFTREWMDSSKDNTAFLSFYLFLFKLRMQQQRVRDKTGFDSILESFMSAIGNAGLRPLPYLIDIVEHLMLIANGSAVAFVPEMDDSALPVSLLQDIYISIYDIKNHTPTIMGPAKLSLKTNPIYYSLAFPTVPGTTPFHRNAPTIIEDQRNLKRLLQLLKKSVDNSRNHLNLLKYVSYDFFHRESESDQEGQIKNSNEIYLGDSRFSHVFSKNGGSRKFCNTSLFFRGCIKISLSADIE